MWFLSCGPVWGQQTLIKINSCCNGGLCDPCELFYYSDCPVNFIYCANTRHTLQTNIVTKRLCWPNNTVLMMFSPTLKSVLEIYNILQQYSSSNRFVYIENYNIENWIFSKNWNLICPNLVVREGIFKEEETRWSGGWKMSLGCVARIFYCKYSLPHQTLQKNIFFGGQQLHFDILSCTSWVPLAKNYVSKQVRHGDGVINGH